jgi:23S rRNA (guanosine2251-2'-O)-methyltransferase
MTRRDRSPKPFRRREPPHREASDLVLLFGLHAVEAALANPHRRLRRLLATKPVGERLEPLAAERGIETSIVEAREIDRLLGAESVHQGVLLEAEPLPEPRIEELAETTDAAAGLPLVVVLDQVTDPHNVGAILRTAAAFGARALVMTDRNAPPLGRALAKSASGALELVPVLRVPNLARALEQLADAGFFRIGLAGEATAALETCDVSGPVALVLGAEEDGLRRLTRVHCDLLCRITTGGRLASLNVSNAAAIALHSTRTRQRSPR